MTTGAQTERRRRLVTRALPISVLAGIAFIAGLAAGNDDELHAVRDFAAAWEDDDFETMHAQLTARVRDRDARRATSSVAYEEAEMTATVASIETGEPELGKTDGRRRGGDRAGDRPHARLRGRSRARWRFPIEDGLVAWTPDLVFPGLEPGETLERRTRAPKRAPILAADGTPLAEGPGGGAFVAARALGERGRRRRRQPQAGTGRRASRPRASPRVPGGDQRASSSPSTTASTASRAASCSHSGRRPARCACSPAPSRSRASR